MRIFQVDAFTDTPFTGNPATVILGADGRGDGVLGAIAREFPHAEVAFVLAPTGPDHDVTVRFFNARKEAPFVGHATLAAHAVLLAEGLRGLGTSRQRSGVGILAVEALERPVEGGGAGANGPAIAFRQTVPRFDEPLPFETTLRVAAALGMPGERLHAGWPARIARKGSTRLLVPVAGAASLEDANPNFEALRMIGTEIGAEGFFLFAPTIEAVSAFTDSRMFCPAIGIPEDPVSGNAHGMLAAYLLRAGFLGAHRTRFVGRQGQQMHRPGRVDVDLSFEHGELTGVRIGGSAVIVSRGRLTV